MGKPLWKFLEDGGIDACIEYGRLPTIKGNSNCCSWALSDFLHYYQRIAWYCCGCGMYNNTNKISFSVEYMKTRFTADLIANGAKFMRLGEEIPKAPDEYYICAAFSSNNDYHFIRGHECGAWTHRATRGRVVQNICNNPKSIKDLIESINEEYRRIFKGWFAIPRKGIQNGIDQAAFNIWKSFGEQQKKTIKPEVAKDIKNLVFFFKEKNNLLQNVTDLENLEYNFRKLVAECFELKIPFNDYCAIEAFLEKYNEVKSPEIINSPERIFNKYSEYKNPNFKLYHPAQNCVATI